jgi:hypothetical protein
MKKRLIPFAAIIILLLAGSAVDAYNTHGRWSGDSATMRASSVGFPAGDAYRTALGTVASRFNQNPSEFRFTQRYDDASVSLDNDQNEVWFSADPDFDPAWTYWWYDIWGDIVEADVVFYNGEDYTTSMSKTSLWSYGGTRRPFQTTALHEYGHAAGLEHEADEYNLMGSDWTHISCNGATARSYVGEDASDGLVHLYTGRDGVAIENVGVTLFRRTGFSGEYSTHGHCKITNSLGTELPYTDYAGQRRYAVDKGQWVRVWFTYENSGETYQNVNVGYYISSNATISTADTLFGTRKFGQRRNNVDTRYVSLKIPVDLVSGTTYWLGAIVDYDNALTEIDEYNAAYHIIRVN